MGKVRTWETVARVLLPAFPFATKQKHKPQTEADFLLWMQSAESRELGKKGMWEGGKMVAENAETSIL